MKPEIILTDIEGTTTAADFVHRVLFPYAHSHLEAYVQAHEHKPEVQQILADTAKTVEEETGTRPNKDQTLHVLKDWIVQDRKHTALKSLQGLIWEEGYKRGDYTSHLYPDVALQLRAWKGDGIVLGVYSSGSAHAQRLLFAHTPAGDLNPLFSYNFDTTVGQKKEAQSYRNILQQLNMTHTPDRVLFLSDVEAELDAAQQAGMRTVQLVRPGTQASIRHTTVATFSDIAL